VVFFKKIIITTLLASTPLFAWGNHSLICTDLLTLNLPLIVQTTDYTCGVACLDSAIKYWKGFSPGELALASHLGSNPQIGTPVERIAAAAHEFGLHSRIQYNVGFADLRRYLSHGETVFVGWVLNGEGHWSVLKGLGVDHITLMDPWHARTTPEFNRLSFFEFAAQWNNGVTLFGQVIRISAYPTVYWDY
jgi:predicted double-glycine peptidase